MMRVGKVPALFCAAAAIPASTSLPVLWILYYPGRRSRHPGIPVLPASPASGGGGVMCLPWRGRSSLFHLVSLWYDPGGLVFYWGKL